ncbi:hypothetical protein KNO81_41430 [Paraburkholderia sediminicola]|nr:hypothetical protein [Paraburkholderia sediminicola]
MHPSLKKNRYYVKQILEVKKLVLLSPAFAYDFFDDQTEQVIMKTSEPPLGFFTKLCRMDKRYRGYTPFEITIITAAGNPVLRIKRGITLMHSKVELFNEHDQLIGILKQTFSPITAKFDLLDGTGSKLAAIKGDWADWDFRVTEGEREVASIVKTVDEGLLTALFRDSFDVKVADHVPEDSPLRPLIVAAAICVDMVRQ